MVVKVECCILMAVVWGKVESFSFGKLKLGAASVSITVLSTVDVSITVFSTLALIWC